MPGYSNGPRIKTDRFGDPFQAVPAYRNDQGFYKAYVELGGKLYAIEFGEQDQTSDRGRKQGSAFRWVRVTQKKKNQRPQSM